MNKNLKYIIDTFRAKFDSQVKVVNSRVRWIQYTLMPTNFIEVKDSTISHIDIGCTGENNRVRFYEGANISYSRVGITGSNNTVIFDGCSGIISITVRGDNQIVKIGRNTIIESAYLVSMGYGNSITIGEDCMFSANIEIWNTDSHLITDLNDNPLNHKNTPINIGNHVWLGKNAAILKGVTIGDNSIVGFNTVVTHDVPSNSVAAGNPALIVKESVTWKKGFITRHFGDTL